MSRSRDSAVGDRVEHAFRRALLCGVIKRALAPEVRPPSPQRLKPVRYAGMTAPLKRCSTRLLPALKRRSINAASARRKAASNNGSGWKVQLSRHHAIPALDCSRRQLALDVVASPRRSRTDPSGRRRQLCHSRARQHGCVGNPALRASSRMVALLRVHGSRRSGSWRVHDVSSRRKGRRSRHWRRRSANGGPERFTSASRNTASAPSLSAPFCLRLFLSCRFSSPQERCVIRARTSSRLWRLDAPFAFSASLISHMSMEMRSSTGDRNTTNRYCMR